MATDDFTVTTVPPLAPTAPGGGVRARRRDFAVRWEHAGLAVVLLVSGLMEFVRLGQNGFANTYYSAAVKSMLRSFHNFFFISADPNGLITVDKPPLGLWLQALSAKVFGFTALSLLIPEGVCAVLAVALLYFIIAPRFGKVAALVGALALAVFPSFVAVARDNGVDPLLILLMLAACGVGLAAIERGSLWRLVACGVLVGLAFNTKTLAALLCVPGIALGYLACAPGSIRRRLAYLSLAGIVALVVCASWSAAVDLTPASQRPFVGSTSANTETQLIFGYNGFGRVGGQQGGPDSTTNYRAAGQAPLVRPGQDTRATREEKRFFAAGHHISTGSHRSAHPVAVRAATGPVRGKVVPFASNTLSPVRIFGKGLGDQAGWIVPLALLGLVALLVAVRRRSDRRAAALLVLGGWFVIELATLDFSKGIVHPYYSSALGPGLAAMVGAGAVALAALVRSKDSRPALLGYILAVVAIAGTVAAQLFLIQRYHYPLWWRIPLVLLCAGALLAIPLLRSRAGWALAVAVGATLFTSAAYSATVWLAPVNGTFPTAGRYDAPGYGGVGVKPSSLRTTRSLIRWVRRHGATMPFQLLTESSDQASPFILLGLQTDAEGGYNTTDPALSATALADLVAAGKARYFYVGGPYDRRGGNGASTAARLVCPEVPQYLWANHEPFAGSWLVDCRGRASELRHPYRFARAFVASHPKARGAGKHRYIL
jgi:4-amino-4-deoxy-L-arabinose transferase-like glycosyltransferase